ncbi:MAG: hypothetical protein ABJQ70_14640, partial [Roseobacter sp.]
GRVSKKPFLFAAVIGVIALAGCEPGNVRTSGSVYYDSMLWNDYYYGSYRPGHGSRPDRPDRPNRPDRPTKPPSGGIDPGFSRPPAAHLPSHRPSGGRGRRR